MGKMPKILIVDDVEDKVEILSRQLKQEGYEILKAYNGEDAIEIVRKQKLDLILMDISMPHMDGFKVTKIIKEENKTIFLPIIIVTASKDDTESIVMGLESGADDYISLPCKREEILARVKAMLRTKQLHDELSQKNIELKKTHDSLKLAEENLNKKVKELGKEKAKLEKMNNFMIGRELKMVELKQEINSLLEKSGKPKKYEGLGKTGK